MAGGLKLRRWVKWIALTAGLLLLAIAAYSIWIYQQATPASRDGYAQWGVGEMIVAYYDKHREFPKSWDDLKLYEDEASHRVMNSFEDMQGIVEIGFEKLPLLRTRPPEGTLFPRVIRLRSGSRSHRSGAEPNELVQAGVARISAAG